TEDSLLTHAAALAHVDSQLPPLFDVLRRRGLCLCVLCSDHGTAYGEDGFSGHRLSHPVVWTVPYAELLLPEAAPWPRPPPRCWPAPRIRGTPTPPRTRRPTARSPRRCPCATCGRPSGARRCCFTCTSRSARCAAAFATSSPSRGPGRS